MKPSFFSKVARFIRDIRGESDGSVTIQRQSGGSAIGTYPGSEVTDTSADFLGDWRALNAWHQFDLRRVRNRSRQLERGDPLCIAFKRNMLNNTFGAFGFHFEPLVETGKQYGDATDGDEDEGANKLLSGFYDEMGRPENLTTRKLLSRRDLDRLLLSRLIFDGEFIVQKWRGFPENPFGFAWQPINPDYLNHYLNRIESGLDHDGKRVAEPGNITRMGVELDKTFKFPVAYWFWRRRPNDNVFNYAEIYNQLFYRVPAAEVIHVFLQTEDEEQTRGWPWPFAAAVNLFRMGKFAEAALVNATIGARSGVFFKKKYPEGFIEGGGDPKTLNDDGSISMELPEGSGWELPYGVEPEVVNMRYPDAALTPFMNAMNLHVGSVFGTSYATTTGDLSQANFVSSRMGQLEEREHYMSVQEFLIEKWKKPGFDEELFRGLLSGKLNLPRAKFDKFNKPDFTGRRWKFVQPVDDQKAKELALNNLQCSIGDVIRETSQESPKVVFKRIAKEKALLESLGIERIISFKSEVVGANEPQVPGTGTTPEPPPAKK